MKIDLHTHTTASDGEMTPKEMIDEALKRGLEGVAITDHETAKGCIEAREYAKDKPIEFISGIEIGCDDHDLGLYDVHIVGLFIEPEDEMIKKVSEDMKKAREEQKEGIIKKLNTLGYEVRIEELKEEANGASYGRPHVAKILMRKYPSRFSSKADVFNELLDAKTGRAYVSQKRYTIPEAIDIIKRAGGVSVLAHPGLCFEKANQVIEKFLSCGGQGIEVDYAYQSARGFSKEKADEEVGKYERVANEKGVLVSGGTDFHNEREYFSIGEHGVTMKEFEKIKDAAKGRTQRDRINK